MFVYCRPKGIGEDETNKKIASIKITTELLEGRLFPEKIILIQRTIFNFIILKSLALLL